MRKYFYLFAFLLLGWPGAVHANTGDTTWVRATHVNLDYYNNFDSAVVFPNGTVSYRKIYVIFTVGQYTCPGNPQYCHQWDYDIENYVMTAAGDTLELARLITPYATSGTPGFGSAWQQHYIYDITDYYPILRNHATVRSLYSGYSGGFTYDVRFAFIEGTPERNVLGHDKLWDNNYTYGDISAPSHVIDSALLPMTKTAPAGTQAAEMKMIITGHGSDHTSGCCEFDGTGIGHTYDVVVNNTVVAQTNMNIKCGTSEIYPQGGTWLIDRAGNWCPGERVTMRQYKMPGITAGTPYTVDINFDDSYDGGGSYGDYKISAAAFYYGPYNHAVDASVEDIIAPTKFEWYKRENPKAGKPIIKIRNTGGTVITSMLIEYGVKDSAMQQYIWTGSLASSHDTIITMPSLNALTSLSLGGTASQAEFVVRILQVNAQADGDSSNNRLTSIFNIVPVWPSDFAVNLLTSSVDANGNLGSSRPSLSDASWQITDQNNVVVASRNGTVVKTTYKDTVSLVSSGLYKLTVNTSQCRGLQWWYFELPPPNNTPGYAAGSLGVIDINSQANIPVIGDNGTNGQFRGDFGCGFVQYFTSMGQCNGINPPAISRSGDILFVPAGMSSYQWYYNGVLIPGGTSNTYTMTHNNGNYTVKIADGNGCNSMSANFAIINLGVNELYDFSTVSIAPNPARDQFTLSVGTELLGTPYMLTDLTGRTIYTGDIKGQNTPLSVAGLSTGIYLLTIGIQNTHSFKIVKD